MESAGARWCWVCFHPIDPNDRDVVTSFQTIDRVQRAVAMHGRCRQTDVGRKLKLQRDLAYAPRFGAPDGASSRR